MEIQSIEQRVQNGIDLLNKKRVTWFYEVDTRKLNQRSGKNDVLGQVYGTFLLGIDRLDIYKNDIFDAAYYGFIAYRDSELEDRPTEYEMLTEEWKKRIEEIKLWESTRTSKSLPDTTWD